MNLKRKSNARYLTSLHNVRTARRLVRVVALVSLVVSALSILAQPPSDSLYTRTVQAARTGWDAAHHLSLGDAWRTRGDWPQAAAHYAAAFTLNPANPAAARALADASLALGRIDAALPALESLMTHDPTDLTARYQLGLTLTAYDPRGALVHLVAASSVNPDVASALIGAIQAADGDLFAIGAALFDQDEWLFAENAFREAYHRTADTQALAYVALARAAQGKEARGWLAQAVTLAPDNPSVRYAEGLTLQLLRDYNGALSAFNAGLTLAPDDPALYAAMGALFAETGDVVTAQTWYQRAVSISRDAPQFVAALEQFNAQYGALIESNTETIEQALVEVTAESEADKLAVEGWSRALAGDVTGGSAQIDAALALDADSLLAQFYKANLLMQQGDTAAARPYLARVAAATESPLAALAQQTLDALIP